MTEASAEDTHKHVGHHTLCEQAEETTEVSAEATAGSEKTVAAPQRGGDGVRRVVSSWNSGTDGLGNAILAVFGERGGILVEGNRFVSRRVLILDYCKYGINLADGILDKEDSREEDDEVEENDEPGPVGELIDRALGAAGIGTIDDGTLVDGRRNGGVLMHNGDGSRHSREEKA